MKWILESTPMRARTSQKYIDVGEGRMVSRFCLNLQSLFRFLKEYHKIRGFFLNKEKKEQNYQITVVTASVGEIWPLFTPSTIEWMVVWRLHAELTLTEQVKGFFLFF
ncbi:hypothetical protein V6Z11_A06G070800 [Gossypium hirsutum]